MMATFANFIENIMEVFMNDFSVFGCSFDSCLHNLGVVLQRCRENNLVLNWEKCHFKEKEGIVIGHLVSSKGLEFDHTKIATIKTLVPLITVRGIRSLLGHAGFNRRFIKDFLNFARPLCKLLKKDATVNIDKACMRHSKRSRRN